MEYESIIKTAQWLGNDRDIFKLCKLKSIMENKQFYVTVWGHFSAGKSRLINNILKRDILPSQTRETTSALTYLQYGQQEQCVVIYDDGSHESYDIEMLKNIFQNTEQFEKTSKIDHIEAYVNSEILKSGIVLVDTPGVNTVISKHQELAVDAISQSGRIIYVLGSSPSAVDKDFVHQIADCGVKICFVRTKCDNINNDEENAQDSIKQEMDDMASFIGTDIDYIPVSNLEGNEWYDNLEKVRTLLADISSQLEDEMEKANQEKLTIYAKQYLDELNIEKQRIEELIEGESESVNSELSKYEKDLSVLNNIEAGIEKKIEKNVDTAKNESRDSLNSLLKNRKGIFKKEIDCIGNSDNISEEARAVYSKNITDSIEKIQQLLNSYFEGIVKEEMLELSDIGEDIDVAPTYGEVQMENSRVLNMYRSQLNAVRSRLEEIRAEEAVNKEKKNDFENSFDEEEYEATMQRLNEELNNIPSEPALCITEEQGIQPSSVFKTVGDAADLALLLLPGDAIVEGVKYIADATKLAQFIHKFEKAEKAVEVVGKNANAIDKVRDFVYAVKNVFGKRKYSTAKEKERAEIIVDGAANYAGKAFEKYKEEKSSGNVLDALSVAYWAEKLGKNFDHEPKMEVDMEVELERQKLRDKITEEQNRISNERLQKKKELGLLEDNDKKLEILKKENELKEKQIEEEYNKQYQAYMDKANKELTEKYKGEYVEFYSNNLDKISQTISEQYFRTASQNLTMYITSQTQEVKNNIQEKKNQIDRLLEVKKNKADSLNDKLGECKNLIKELEIA